MKRVPFRSVVLLGALALLAGMALPAAVDYYLKIEGIPGESTARGFESQIEVDSWSWGMSQAATAQGRAGTMLGDPTKPFTIVKAIDKASPKLAEALASKQRFPAVTLTLCRAGGDKQKYMEYKMTDVIISSIRRVAAPATPSAPPAQPATRVGGAQNLPMEEVSFNYGKIEWTYVGGGARPPAVKQRNPIQ